MPLELLRTTNGVLARYWYERDGLGNVVALTDASGNVVDQHAYDLWGKPTTVSESVPQQLRYQGCSATSSWRQSRRSGGSHWADPDPDQG
jgi:YD repeat-containing protein